jgi:hypothetical protein
MGVVYEATQLSLNRTVALKVLAPHLSDDDAFRERFRREGLIQAAIDHPNIVTVYEAGETEHGLFIAMRLVRGPTLKDMILAREVDAGRSLRILRPVADALDTAHEAGLIHRDVKPQNVLVAGRDHAYLADFGLTKSVGDTGLTRTGQFVGTLDYIAPEQIQGQPATGKSDVYALGAVLYECLTGIVPYPRDSDVAVLYAHMSDPPPKVSEQRPELPDELDEVVGRAMAKDPGERFETAGELLDAATAAFDMQTRAAVTPPGPIEAPEEAGIRDTEENVATVHAAASPTVKGGIAPTIQAGAAPTVDAPVAPPPPAAPPPSDGAAREPAAAGPARRWWPIVAVAAGVGALVLGVLLGHSGGSKGSSNSQVASAGGVRLSVPKEWSSSSAPPAIPGLSFQNEQLAFSPPHPVDGEGLVAGPVAAQGRLLLPDQFVRTLSGTPSRDTVKLGDLQAYRYTGLAPSGSNSKVTLYTVPTTKGVVTVACVFGSRTPSSFAPACERAAGSLELTSGKDYPLGPSTRYASSLGATIVALNAAVESGSGTLGSAANAKAQAAAASALGAAYGKGANRLAGLELSPVDRPANAALVAALRGTASDYGALAAAARRGDRRAYNSASRAVRLDARTTQRALATLHQLGYPVE